MGDEKRGVIAVVASTGGIKLKGDDTWYNPTATAKMYVKKELKDKEVVLRLADKPNTFSFISLYANKEDQLNKTSTPAVEPKYDAKPEEADVKNFLTKDDYWMRKEERDILKDKQISMHGCINTSVKILELCGNVSSNPDETTIKIQHLAKNLFKWINDFSNLK